MKFPEMKIGLIISALLHAALLVWGLISFAVRPLEAASKEPMPIDIISNKDFTALTKGVKNAPQKETPQPLVDKVGETKPVDEAVGKLNEKREVRTASAEPQPPTPPEQKPPEAKPEKKPPPKVDQIAEALKQEEVRRKAEEKAKAVQQKQQQQQPKFDPNQIAALLDKREQQRTAATGESPVSQPSMGFSGGKAAALSASEIDALRKRLSECWNPPPGLENAKMKVVIRVLFKRDATVASQPVLVAGPPSAQGPAMAESAIRAVLRCQPYMMLRAENYDQWKDIEITFDPTEMFRS